MDLRKAVENVNVTELAAAIEVPRRTLFRWVENNKIPGREAERKLWEGRIEKAARKLLERAA